MALPVLLDPVGKAAKAPILALLNGAAIGFEIGGDLVRNRVDLRLRDIVACDQHAFV